MSKPKNPGVTSAMGVLMTIISSLVGYMKDIYGKLPLIEFIDRIGADFYRLGTEEGEETLRQIAQLIAGTKDKVVGKIKEIMSVLVDYNLSIEEVAAQTGLTFVNSDINSQHFSTNKKGRLEVVVEDIAFNRKMSSNEAIVELDKLGFRPAEIHERCAYQQKYGTQHNVPVVILGSVWRDLHGNRSVAVLYSDGGLRYLHLHWFESDWGADYRFAAVRKQ